MSAKTKFIAYLRWIKNTFFHPRLQYLRVHFILIPKQTFSISTHDKSIWFSPISPDLATEFISSSRHRSSVHQPLHPPERDPVKQWEIYKNVDTKKSLCSICVWLSRDFLLHSSCTSDSEQQQVRIKVNFLIFLSNSSSSCYRYALLIPIIKTFLDYLVVFLWYLHINFFLPGSRRHSFLNSIKVSFVFRNLSMSSGYYSCYTRDGWCI